MVPWNSYNKDSSFYQPCRNIIEVFDNSNLHGTNAVAAMVCSETVSPASRTTRNSK